jgi:hypothetical protein
MTDPTSSMQRLLEAIDVHDVDDAELPVYVIAEHLLGSLRQLEETWERLNG